MLRLRTVFLISPAAAAVVAVAALAACSTTSSDPASGSTSSEVRNDGKEPHGTNPGKLSCEDHGFSGTDTVVDLGGANRTLDLGGGHSVTVSGVKKGPWWTFNYSSDVAISLVLVRSGNKDATIAIDPPAKSGTVTRSEAEGPTKPGLNRIAFCYTPPPPPCDPMKDWECKPPPPPPCDPMKDWECKPPPPPCDPMKDWDCKPPPKEDGGDGHTW